MWHYIKEIGHCRLLRFIHVHVIIKGFLGYYIINIFSGITRYLLLLEPSEYYSIEVDLRFYCEYSHIDIEVKCRNLWVSDVLCIIIFQSVFTGLPKSTITYYYWHSIEIITI